MYSYVILPLHFLLDLKWVLWYFAFQLKNKNLLPCLSPLGWPLREPNAKKTGTTGTATKAQTSWLA